MLFSQGATIVVQERWRLGWRPVPGRETGALAWITGEVRPEVRLDGHPKECTLWTSEPLHPSTTTRDWHPSACAFPARVPRGRGCLRRRHPRNELNAHIAPQGPETA